MEVILYILLGLIGIALLVYLFHLLRLVAFVLAMGVAAYLCFFKDSVLGACVVMGGWYALNCAMDSIVRAFGESQDTGTKKSKETQGGLWSSRKSVSNRRRKVASSDVNWNFILMCLIPLCWPILIFQTFFGDKQAGELNAYDYEQHLKSNGK